MSSLDSVTRLLPAGFYSTFRTFSNRQKVLGFRAHLQRLYRPARLLGIQPSVPPRTLRLHLAHLLADFPSEEARIRLILSRLEAPGAIFVVIEPLVELPLEAYSHGVRVGTTLAHRDHPALKTTDFINQSQVQRRQAREQALFEALMVHHGRILEGLTSNFFYMRNGTLGTARSGVLNGVTRRQVLQLAAGQGIPVQLRSLHVIDLPFIQEAFLTSSSRGIVPVISIDEIPVGHGRVGQGTRKLMKVYAAGIVNRLESIG
jgi:branched-chain amino acid aminotransferase